LPLCMMASFKQHCGFGFWLSRQVVGESAQDGMGQFGKITSLTHRPSRTGPHATSSLPT
jgi:hypothetical protein